MTVKDITNNLEQWAPLSLQESYDNSGLILGDPKSDLKNILITLDVTEEVIDEAISKKCNLIVAHHPLVFQGLKKLTGKHWVERCVIKAIKEDISIYAIHTNLDNTLTGVNARIARQIGLQNTSILSPKSGLLIKLVTFVPHENVQAVLDALYLAGAGEIGNYDHCSFRVSGTGTFRPGDETQPHIGSQGTDESVEEARIEVILPRFTQHKVMSALKQAHPYEEVAYYLTELNNKNQEIGSGMIGQLANPMSETEFLSHLKSTMQLDTIRHTRLTGGQVKIVALCGGSGSFLLGAAKAAKADVFITGDFKYHDFFEAEDKIVIADIGHYESEVFTKELIHDHLRENFTNIALHLSEVVTNPINYF